MVLLYKSISTWLLLLLTAIANAVVREQVLVPLIGVSPSLPVSGLILSILIFIVAYLSIPIFVPRSVAGYFSIGIIWFVMTLGFEFLFGLLVLEKTWQEIFQVFNIFKGNLFVMALISTLISPWLSAKLRGYI